MEHWAQETCKSAGPNGGLPLLLLFVTPAGPARERSSQQWMQGHAMVEKARWNDHSSYLVGRWVSSMLFDHRRWFIWLWRVHFTSEVGGLVRRHISCYSHKIGGRCLLLWRWVSSSPRITGSNSCLHTILIYHDEFILNQLVSFSIRTAISLDRHGYLQIIHIIFESHGQ